MSVHAKLKSLAKQADKEFVKATTKWLVALEARKKAWAKLIETASKLDDYERKRNL